jgi:hypothetical protein
MMIPDWRRALRPGAEMHDTFAELLAGGSGINAAYATTYRR